MRIKTRAAAALVVIAAVAAVTGYASAASGKSDAVPTSFVYGVPGVPTQLDPAIYQGDPTRWVSFELGGTLVSWATEKLKKQGCAPAATAADVKPELIESWKKIPQGYLMTLRANAKDPKGNVVTSQDVDWTFARNDALKATGTVAQFLMHQIADYADDPIEVVNKRQFRLLVKSHTALDMAILTLAPWFRIFNSTEAKKYATADDPWAKAYIAKNSPNFGPFQLTGFAPGSAAFMTRNPNYWGPRGNVKKLIIKAIPHQSTRSQLLQSGELDFAGRLSYSDYNKLQTTPGISVQRCLSGDRDTLVLNLKDKEFANEKVRQAISMAIDRAALVKAAYLGGALPARYGVGVAYPFPKSAAVTYKHDVAAAKKLLADAGYPNGFTKTVTISSSRPGPEVQVTTALVAAQLRQIGITLNIDNIASAVDFSNRYFAGNYQAMMYLEPPAVMDPFYSLSIYNTSYSFQNSFKYNNPAYDKVIAQLRTTDPGPARQKLTAEAAKIIVETNPMIYLVDKTFVHAVRSGRWSNWQHAPNGELYAVYLKGVAGK